MASDQNFQQNALSKWANQKALFHKSLSTARAARNYVQLHINHTALMPSCPIIRELYNTAGPWQMSKRYKIDVN